MYAKLCSVLEGRMYSSYVPAVQPRLTLEYALDRTTTPRVGTIFAGRMWDGVSEMIDMSCSSVVGVILLGDGEREDQVEQLGAHYLSRMCVVRAFWENQYVDVIQKQPLPAATVTLSSFTPRKIGAVMADGLFSPYPLCAARSEQWLREQGLPADRFSRTWDSYWHRVAGS